MQLALTITALLTGWLPRTVTALLTGTGSLPLTVTALLTGWLPLIVGAHELTEALRSREALTDSLFVKDPPHHQRDRIQQTANQYLPWVALLPS